MKKQHRLLFSAIILLILCSAACYALYQHVAREAEQKGGAVLRQPAANFRLPAVSGGEIELNNLKGKAVLVNFWGSFCEPCKREMPAIQKAYDRYKEAGFEVVAVNVQESKAAVKHFLDHHGLSFPAALDQTAEVYRSWEIFYLPASIFINPDGVVERMYVGEMSARQLDQWINELLKNT
ncbi:thiol-disulfide oxidoreductase ResA [Bacillus swezeyi]|uniref:thiol-disulfide oxidoreductase ResA n=1 Tax=Bacillus swezeyi TaxID=1925020 RepID=UPI0039C68A1D